ncbi:MAG: methylornithine synthase PylB [Desulfobacterales bacterium]
MDPTGPETMSVSAHPYRLQAILDAAVAGQAPDDGEIRFLLTVNDEADRRRLYAAARTVRSRFFGRGVFTYGFVYFSTYCRNDCLFCHYRKSNTALHRYRKSISEIIETARAMAAAGAHLVDLTMGEWPGMTWSEGGVSLDFPGLARAVKKACGLPLMVSPGVAAEETLAELGRIGAEWYACYQETHNRRLFAQLRSGQDYDRRMAAKQNARRSGMLIEEGILIGVGESTDDIADSVQAMRELDADQVRVMTFVPQKGTPMEDRTTTAGVREEVVIAVLRLALPDRLIPASLDVGGLAGLRDRLDAGANVVTSIVLPGNGFAGVANKVLDIDESRRTPQAILPVLEACGLTIADRADYQRYIERRRGRGIAEAAPLHRTDTKMRAVGTA